jgi:hypothetical protein
MHCLHLPTLLLLFAGCQHTKVFEEGPAGKLAPSCNFVVSSHNYWFIAILTWNDTLWFVRGWHVGPDFATRINPTQYYFGNVTLNLLDLVATLPAKTKAPLAIQSLDLWFFPFPSIFPCLFGISALILTFSHRTCKKGPDKNKNTKPGCSLQRCWGTHSAHWNGTHARACGTSHGVWSWGHMAPLWRSPRPAGCPASCGRALGVLSRKVPGCPTRVLCVS